MNSKAKNFSRYIFVLGSALLLFFGGGALSIVWLRMEISAVAKNCGQLEGQMEIVGREVNQLRGQKSKSLRPSSLARRQLRSSRLSGNRQVGNPAKRPTSH